MYLLRNKIKIIGSLLLILSIIMGVFNITKAEEKEGIIAEDTSEVITTENTKDSSEVITTESVETTMEESTEETTEPEEEPDVKILFIGNSSTYYNDMPEMLKGMAKADGIIAKIDSVTAPNYTMPQFANEENSYHKKIVEELENEQWDFVILQDHRDSIISNTNASKTALKSLKELIDMNGAKAILYETQADYIGKNFKINGTTVYLNHAQIQYYLNQYYYAISNELDAQIATVGVNYTRCMRQYPDINLYANDFIHPTTAGSYLAACTIYGQIFDKSAYGNKFVPGCEEDTEKLLDGITEDAAKKIQSIADVTLSFDNKIITMQKSMSGKVEAKMNKSFENMMQESSNTITYFSLNDKIVAVDQYNGQITATATGETMIMARTESGLMALCNIQVVEPATAFVIDENNITRIYKKDTFRFTATLYPADTTDQITWTSNKPEIVSVDENGVVTAKKLGTAKITAITDSGIKLTRKVYVRLKAPTKIKAKKISTKAKSNKRANIYIEWKKNTKADQYYIYRSTKKGSGYKQIAKPTKNHYTDKNKIKGKTYYYKIKAIYSNTKCNSLKSKAVKIVLPK